jgi:DNA-formamidopyrimidine glycosylase
MDDVGNRVFMTFRRFDGRYKDIRPSGFERFGKNEPIVEVLDIGNKGKFTYWKLVDCQQKNTSYMHVTYGMTGQWYLGVGLDHRVVTVDVDVVNENLLSDYYVNLTFEDPRHYGTLKFVDEKAHARKLDSLGPDILDSGIGPTEFATRLLKKYDKTICEVLMDQSVVAGVGNYIKAETLYASGISPNRLVSSLESEDFIALHRNVVEITESSYKSGGARIKTYTDVDGTVGSNFQFEFQVYSKKTCPKGHPITKENTRDGRTSHWCMTCQS